MNMFSLSPAEQARDQKTNYLTLFLKLHFSAKTEGSMRCIDKRKKGNTNWYVNCKQQQQHKVDYIYIYIYI